MQIDYRSDVYEAGRDEDGEMVYGEEFYVFAEMEDGTRYRHNHSFNDTVWVNIEDQEDYGVGGFYDRDKNKAVFEVVALMQKVENTGIIDIKKYWSRLSPAYGSQAYCVWESQATIEELYRD